MSPITEAPGTFGAAFSPEEWASWILVHLSAQSVVLQSGATRVDTPNRIVHIPRVTGDGGTGWYAELSPIGAGDPTGNQLTLEPHKIAAISTVSNEAVTDSSPSALDAIGTAMLRAIALAADRAYFVGTGAANNEPTGILTLALPKHVGAVDYAGIVGAAGVVRAAGGQPNALYCNPSDLTSLQLATDGLNRPLIQPDAQQGMAESIAGLRIWATPAVPAASALIAQADQVVVAVRSDPTIAVSSDAQFDADAALVRAICRTDVGIGDVNGLCVISAK